MNADVQNEGVFSKNKKALQVHCSAQPFSGYSTGKSNKTLQQCFKLIVSLLNAIYFCQRWSFTFCTASLRVALVLKTLLKQNTIVFQQGLYLSVWKAWVPSLQPPHTVIAHETHILQHYTLLPSSMSKAPGRAVCILPCPTSKDVNQNLHIALWYQHGKMPKATRIKFGAKHCSESII